MRSFCENCEFNSETEVCADCSWRTKRYQIPKFVTNGDVIKTLFSDAEITEIFSSLDKAKLLGLEWWNAPYREEKENTVESIVEKLESIIKTSECLLTQLTEPDAHYRLHSIEAEACHLINELNDRKRANMTREEAIEILKCGEPTVDEIEARCKYNEAIDMAIEALKLIPDNATNGDVVKALFPDAKSKRNLAPDILYFGGSKTRMRYTNEWWNAPYRKE